MWPVRHFVWLFSLPVRLPSCHRLGLPRLLARHRSGDVRKPLRGKYALMAGADYTLGTLTLVVCRLVTAPRHDVRKRRRQRLPRALQQPRRIDAFM